MHRIVKSHLNTFVQENGLDADSEAVQFEKFTNFSILSSKIASTFELDDVTTGEDDDGTDGLALIINEEHVVSDDDARLIFSNERRNNDVEVVFIQAKRSEGFNLGDILKFRASIKRFLTESNYTPNSDLQLDVRGAFDVAIENAPRVRGGKPSISVYFVTTGRYQAPDALETARNEIVEELNALGFFQNIDVKFIGREELLTAWMSSYNGVEASLVMQTHAPLPQIAGIEESYLVIAKAKDYVNNLLLNEDNSVRSQIFEENVRHFLGTENPVNQQIKDTLLSSSGRSRFPVLNNGVTIVSPDVRVQGTTLHVSNFQVVNGCQTSHVLYENRDDIADDVLIALKVVETTDEDVFSELVRATNSQTKIDDPQFLSLSPLTKSIEAYFNTYDGQDGRLYFERRDKQYVGKGIPAIRVVSLHNAAKCVCAMFLHRPDLAFKYPKRMYEALGEEIFKEGNKEAIFYASALTLYRFHLLTSNSAIPQNMRKFKWHILPMVAKIVAGPEVPRLNSNAVEQYAQKIIDAFQHHSDAATSIFAQAVEIIEGMDEITNDRLKRQTVLEELLAQIPSQSEQVA